MQTRKRAYDIDEKSIEWLNEQPENKSFVVRRALSILRKKFWIDDFGNVRPKCELLKDFTGDQITDYLKERKNRK